jgi:hypothetical protein
MTGLFSQLATDSGIQPDASQGLWYVDVFYSTFYCGSVSDTNSSFSPGTDVMIFKYFRRKFRQKIGVFDSK